MDKYNFDRVVIGGGIVGLTISRALAIAGIKVALIDSEDELLRHASSRNSEVLHSGLYYSNSPLKQEMCQIGQKLLYDHLATNDIPHKRCGKVVFAKTIAESETLDEIEQYARRNGVKIISQKNSERWCDHIAQKPYKSFFVPHTGVLDTHQFAKSLETEFQDYGGVTATGVQLNNIYCSDHEVEINCTQRDESFVISCRKLINAAGAGSLNILKTLNPNKYINYENLFIKGHYFSYAKPSAINHLYYPIPTDHGLGVHLTIDLTGAIRFGPDTVHTKRSADYKPDVAHDEFARQVRKNFEYIRPDALAYSYSGIRSNIEILGTKYSDFKIESDHCGRIISLLGIDSPGLTSSLALASKVKDIVS